MKLLKKQKKNKKLVVQCSLNYDPLREYSKQGNCMLKCPLGKCILELRLENSLKNIVQSMEIKIEESS